MKRILGWYFIVSVLCVLAVGAQPAPAQMPSLAAGQQSMANDAIQRMQKLDPQSAQAFSAAVQRGDYKQAKAIYENFQKTHKEGNELEKDSVKKEALLKKPEPTEPSLFEKTLSGFFPSDISTPLRQFGYDLFSREAASFAPSMMAPVGPDYIIGPGDQFTLTIWGTTEGIFVLQVSKEGNITLPKVGVVPVAGVRFGDLERTIRKNLSRYFSEFNLSIAMGTLKTLTVYVVGEVANPGTYTVSSLTTAYGALFSAGGPTKKGTLRSIQVLRAGKVIKTLDLYDFLLRGDRSQDIKLQNEDTVFVPIIGAIAGIAGTVYRPAIYELKGGETIGDAIQTAGGIMPIALASRLQVSRFSENQKRIIIDIKIDNPSANAAGKTSPLKEKISNMDTVTVFPIYDKTWETVNLDGDVRHPGTYQWRTDLRLREIIQQGQLLPTSDLRRAEVIRLTKDLMDRSIIPVDLEVLLTGSESENIPLEPQDMVRVYTTFRAPEKVMVAGEVVRPGEYEINKGEHLSDLLKRVGGFTPEAYPYGIVFKREEVKSAQSRNLQVFITKMQTQILQAAASSTATALSADEATFTKSEMSLNQGLLDNLKAMQDQMEGRIAINITSSISEWEKTKDDLLLLDGDILYVPKRPQEVLVFGEVYSVGAQIYRPGMTVKDYLEQAGGYTNYADKEAVFVLQANGIAFGKNSPKVGNIESVTLNAGDSIFVPQKVERYAVMRATKDIIDILFKSAVVLATIIVLF